MHKLWRVAFWVVCGCLIVSTGCEESSGTRSRRSRYYNGRIAMRIDVTVKPQGFGYYTTGTVTLTFDPAPDDFVVTVRLNAMSISGSARTQGKTRVRVPISGSSVADPLRIDPSTLTVTDPDQYVLAIIEFNWDKAD